MATRGAVTQLLAAWRAGDEAARDALMSLVYAELHRIARRHMRGERADHTLQTTALVNEAYLRLAGQRGADWQTRAHFFAVASEAMRRILVDHARRRQSAKRGAGAVRVELPDGLVREQPAEVIAIDEALTRLAELDVRQSRIVELRYFAGLTVEEIAACLDLSPATIKREWSTAKAWLARELRKR